MVCFTNGFGRSFGVFKGFRGLGVVSGLGSLSVVQGVVGCFGLFVMVLGSGFRVVQVCLWFRFVSGFGCVWGSGSVREKGSSAVFRGSAGLIRVVFQWLGFQVIQVCLRFSVLFRVLGLFGGSGSLSFVQGSVGCFGLFTFVSCLVRFTFVWGSGSFRVVYNG